MGESELLKNFYLSFQFLIFASIVNRGGGEGGTSVQHVFLHIFVLTGTRFGLPAKYEVHHHSNEIKLCFTPILLVYIFCSFSMVNEVNN